jgi:hypothetical protein
MTIKRAAASISNKPVQEYSMMLTAWTSLRLSNRATTSCVVWLRCRVLAYSNSFESRVSSSDELDMPKVRCDVETSLVRWAPRTQGLIWIGCGACNSAEEIHPPVRTLGGAIVHIENAQRDDYLTGPFMCLLIELSRSAESIS